jgi:hypothetical protein
MAHLIGLPGSAGVNDGQSTIFRGRAPFANFIKAAQAADADVMFVEAADINTG